MKNGRALTVRDPRSYFVDDENSGTLFLGYAVAAKRLQKQLKAQSIAVDAAHPLFVCIPCGVGGAPGGVSFELKLLFGDSVHCFFVEPTQAPCMLLGMATGRNQDISVQDIGLTGLTHAGGLAVGRPSGFVGRVMKHLLSGEFTIRDGKLCDYMRDLLASEQIFLEPSACAHGARRADAEIPAGQSPHGQYAECSAHRMGNGRQPGPGGDSHGIQKYISLSERHE